MPESLLSRIKVAILLGLLGYGGCSLQDFDALGARANEIVGGLDQSVGGSSDNAGRGGQVQTGTETSGGASGNGSGGNTSGAGGATSTGGIPTAGGAIGAGGTGGTASTTTTTAAGGPAVNLATNPSFEASSSGWSADPPAELGVPNSTYSAYVQGAIGTATVHHGSRQLSIYNGSRTFRIKLYQVINGLADGQYTWSGWFTRGTMTSAVLYATGCGGVAPAQVAIPVGDIWTMVSVTGIQVVGGRCEVGFQVDGGVGDWLNADDFTFTPVSTASR